MQNHRNGLRRRPYRRSLRGKVAGGGLIAAAVAVPLAIHAETANRFLLDNYFPLGIPGYGNELGVTVLSRARPQYDPLGVRVGDFIIRPEIDEGLGYNSNVLGESGGKGSLQEETSGSLRVNSDWGRDSLAAELTFDDRRTPTLPQENQTDWSGTIGGTHEFGRDALTLTASHLVLHQDPTDIGGLQPTLPGSYFSAPLPFTLDDVRASYATEFGRVTLIPAIEYEALRFSDLHIFGLNGAVVPAPVGGTILGTPISQAYRDRDLVTGGVTGRWEFTPAHNAVLVVQDINTNYVSSQRDSFGPNRSSNATQVLVGLDYTASGVWRYRALIGYEIRDFHNATYKSHDAPVGEANVIWQPSGLTTVTGRVVRSIEDAADESIGGYDYTSGRLQVDHEYARNILLNGYVGLQRADYLQTSNNETYYGGGAGATWLVNRNVHLSLTYDVSQRIASANFGTNYLTNTALLTVKFGL